ncbi:hypothetical protein THF1C08_160050 [Vibrio jasicida]|uniref:Uncharacterized protein n=1 Tax=Vibrio jasicida TaxID=766224 RepID=A0AAU9QHJ1_9VIBR|nr:hypothetical protein THF1C08_160050 [Vibrio jasicida]CAH1576613.1 hypothetical protein THF1A12_140050 [Vibrio jasicida]
MINNAFNRCLMSLNLICESGKLYGFFWENRREVEPTKHSVLQLPNSVISYFRSNVRTGCSLNAENKP